MRIFSQSIRTVVALAFMTLVPLVTHLCYSELGFNPAHDGAVLSAARRLLEGQVPHRDFILLHPVLSPLLHVPILWLAGQEALWLSRLFIWFQLAVIAWAWVALINRMLKNCVNVPAQLALALLALVFSATSFPGMAWHSLNGLFLAAMGLSLCLRDRPFLKMSGYFLCGCAVLCKPSFAILVLVVLLTTPEWRRLKYWLAAALPSILYLLFLSFTGALYDAVLQMFPWSTIQPSLRISQFGFGGYMAAGYFAMRWIYGVPMFALSPHQRWLQVLLGWLVIGFAPFFPDFMAVFNSTLDEAILNLFWALAGAGVYFIMETTDRRQAFGRLAGWAMALAWAVAITRYNVSAAICGGILMAPLVVMSLAIVSSAVARTIVIILLAGLALFGFRHGRQLVTGNVPTGDLTYPLNSLYPGAQCIYSSANTHMFTADLRSAVALAGQWPRPYAIIPDCPGYWATSGQANPLPFDSLREIEYYNPDLLDRAMGSIDAQRTNLTILVQIVDANRLGSTNEVQKLGRHRNYVVSEIRNNKRVGFKKIGETGCFELYE